MDEETEEAKRKQETEGKEEYTIIARLRNILFWHLPSTHLSHEVAVSFLGFFFCFFFLLAIFRYLIQVFLQVILGRSAQDGMGLGLFTVWYRKGGQMD